MRLSFFVFLLLNCSLVLAQSFDAKDYKIAFFNATDGKEQLIALRSFKNNGQPYLLLVNPQTFQTKVALAGKYSISKTGFEEILSSFRNTPYVQALILATQKDIQLQNAGIDHSIPDEKGITLTIDLCPSHKDLDRIIFQSVFDEFKKIELPVPLGVSVSGKWMLKHADDLNWLKGLVEKGELSITWINHSYNHEVNALPIAENFLLAPGTDFNVEVLENEKLMLKNGIVPSVFFRFPGLVSNKILVEKLEQYGLITVGSDAWLAKGQHVHSGSIVLIHGNGNEETGVNDFIRLLKTNYKEVQQKQWLLFDLGQGLKKAY
jgi:hypothetical protein